MRHWLVCKGQGTPPAISDVEKQIHKRFGEVVKSELVMNEKVHFIDVNPKFKDMLKDLDRMNPLPSFGWTIVIETEDGFEEDKHGNPVITK